ncbi:MAG: HAD family hydrolase [Myxococcales bacterium]|nr:HAD family hydrolase [Myxococcales bacterium]
MPVRLVVTDMDNTLYSWVDYIVPAVEAMVDAVCRATGFPKIKVVQSLKQVYSRYESNEYPFALQESSLFSEFPDFASFDKLVIDPARAAFSQARRKYLRPYKGVVPALEGLKERGIPVVALTDAPRNPAEYRAKRMGLDRLLTALYTLPGFHFPSGSEGEKLVAPDILRREERGDYRASCPVVELPREYEKPNPAGMLQVCRESGVAPAETLVIGDSLRKDVGVARAVGAIDCWAEYGTYVSIEYRERLDIISAISVTRRHAASVYEADKAERDTATHALSSFAQVLEVVEESARASRKVAATRGS